MPKLPDLAPSAALLDDEPLNIAEDIDDNLVDLPEPDLSPPLPETTLPNFSPPSLSETTLPNFSPPPMPPMSPPPAEASPAFASPPVFTPPVFTPPAEPVQNATPKTSSLFDTPLFEDEKTSPQGFDLPIDPPDFAEAPASNPPLIPPEDLPTLVKKRPEAPDDLLAPVGPGDDLVTPVMDDDLPPPLEAQQDEPFSPEPIELPQVHNEDNEDTGARATGRSRGRLVATIAAAVILAAAAGVGAFRFVTGSWPLASSPVTPTVAQKDAQKDPAAQKPIPPLPDPTAVDGADLDALSDSLAVLDDRAARFAERHQPLPEPDQSLRLKILWHGAVLEGSRAFADKLTKQAAALPDANASPDAERASAAAAFLADDDKRASDILSRLLARDKGDPEALLLQGYQKLRAGDGNAAAKSFDALLVVRPKSINALLGLADAADAGGDDTGEAAWLKQAATLQPNNLRVALATALHEDDERKLKAVDDDRDSLGDRDEAKLDFALALIAAKALRSGEMMTRLQASVSEWPTPDACRRLGWMHLYANHTAEAEQAFAKAEAIDKANQYAETIFLGRAQIALRKNEADTVPALLAKAQKAGVPPRSLQLVQGWLLEQQGKTPLAAKAYAAALKADKNFSWAFVSLERASGAKLKPKARVARLLAAAKKFPDARVAVATGDAWLEDGNPGAAAQSYDSALRNDPWAIDYPAVVARYSSSLTKSGRPAEAARVAMLATPVDPKDIAASTKAANIAIAANDYDTAGDLAQKALAEHENDTSLMLITADVQQHQNMHDKARETLNHVLKINDNLGSGACVARAYVFSGGSGCRQAAHQARHRARAEKSAVSFFPRPNLRGQRKMERSQGCVFARHRDRSEERRCARGARQVALSARRSTQRRQRAAAGLSASAGSWRALCAGRQRLLRPWRSHQGVASVDPRPQAQSGFLRAARAVGENQPRRRQPSGGVEVLSGGRQSATE